MALSAGAFARTLAGMQRVHVVFLLMVGCHSPPTSGGEASAAPSTPAVPAPVASAASTSAPEGPLVPAPSLSQERLTLEGGASIALPQGATASVVREGRMPKEVKHAHLFHLGSEKRLLMVNEFALEGKSCKDRLDEEWKRMSTAKDDADPTRLKFRRMRVVDDVTIADNRALYLEFEQQGLADGRSERPKAGMASIAMCREPNHVVVTFASNRAELPQGTRGLLEGMVKSYQPGANR